jgi:hypothetical protein
MGVILLIVIILLGVIMISVMAPPPPLQKACNFFSEIYQIFCCFCKIFLSQLDNKDSYFENLQKISCVQRNENMKKKAGNTKGGSITVCLASCLTGLESAV